MINKLHSLISKKNRLTWSLLLHFFVCSIGLYKLAIVLANYFYDVYLLDFAVAKLGSNALQIGYGKLAAFFQYLIGCVILFIWYGFALYCIKKLKTETEVEESLDHSRTTPILFLLLSFAANLFFISHMFHGKNALTPWVIGWPIVLFLLPAYCIKTTLKKWPVISGRLALCFSVILTMQVGLIFYPLIFKPMLIQNDFMDMPGETQLISGAYVDNTQYINQHHIGGIIKYDPRIDAGYTPSMPDVAAVTLKDAGLVNQFIALSINDAKYHYLYDSHKHQLSVTHRMTLKEYDYLHKAFSDAFDRKQIDSLYLLSAVKEAKQAERVYTEEEADFLIKNKMELIDQAKTGWFFYHHNYFFEPILALAKGAAIEHQSIVYGWLATLVFVKILPFIGGVNYQSYFKLLFSFYPIYFLGLLAVVYGIFRKSEYLLLASLLATISFFMLGIEPLLLAPGFNPIRHFADIFALFAFYCYLSKRKISWLCVSLSLSVLTVLLNKEFGLFISAAIGLSVLIDAISRRSLQGLSTILLVCFAGIVTYCYLYVGKVNNPEISYMLLGIGSPLISYSAVKHLLLFCSSMYCLAIILRKCNGAMYFFWLSTLFYCQFLLVYFIWYPAFHHIVASATPFILLILASTYLLIRYFNTEHHERRILSGLFFLIAIFVYFPSALVFYHGLNSYQANFKHHRLYEWPFKAAKLISTINPLLFDHAVKLIQTYQVTPGLYIISRYDDILPVLAGKYSEMRVPELLTNVVNQNEINRFVATILSEKPRYLFVDADITRSFNNEVYAKEDPFVKRWKLYDYSLGRVSSLPGLKAIYQGILSEYHEIDRCELIAVYERISNG